MDDQLSNTIIVYSCIYGGEDGRKKSKRNPFTETVNSATEPPSEIPVYSRELLAEVCNLNIPEISFGVYQKNPNIEYDYEILMLMDTSLINTIENSNNESKSLTPYNETFDLSPTVYEEPDISSFDTDLSQIKELILPFKKIIHEEIDFDDDEEVDDATIPFLRTRCLIIPIKLSKTWTLVWVKFSKLVKYVEIFQFSGLKIPTDKLSYKSQEFIKLIIADLLDLQDDDDLMFSFRYIPKNMDSDYNADLIIVKNIQGIIKGYQMYGFNLTPFSLPEMRFDDTRNYVRHTRARALPLMDLKEIRDFNSKNTKRIHKHATSVSSRNNGSTNTTAPLSNTNTNETRKRNPPLSNVNSTASASRLLCNTSGQSLKTADRRRTQSERRKTAVSPVKQPSPTSTISDDPMIYVTLDNLEKIKDSIDYDKEKMDDLVAYYIQTYDEVEAFLLDKWSKVELFSKKGFSEDKCPFLIYGPSQMEYEIIKEGEIVATNTLKDKIKKYDVMLTTRTMRFLTSSRRWINQRFKLNRKMNSVFYTRDPNLYIPDYRDAPYIVMATHLHYGCISADDTFEITHKNWYISRKMVAFIVAKCYKCQRKKQN